MIDNNLNPVWGQSFKWNGVRDSAVLHGEVKDKGTLRDKSLGTFKLRVSSLLDPPGEVHPFTVPLIDKDSGEAEQGRVNVQMCWKVWNRDNDEVPPQEPKWSTFGDVGATTDDDT